MTGNGNVGVTASSYRLGLHPAITSRLDMRSTASPNDISQCKSMEDLRHALDHTYLRLLTTAQADWQRLSGGQDPSDACISVHIHARLNGKARRRPAH